MGTAKKLFTKTHGSYIKNFYENNTFMGNYIKSQIIAKEVYMGKKSLTKSTTKKKAATKKKTGSKKKEVSAAPKKKTAVKKKTVAKAKATPKKSAVKKKTTAKKPTLKSLIKKDFGSWAPETLFAVMPDEDYLNNFTAPPVIDGMDKTKAKKLKSLLSKQFDLNVTEKPAKAKKPAQKKAEKEAAEKARAEAEAKAKAEKEAAEMAKAEAEAAEKAKAEKEAKEKAEVEAKAKAEKEAAEKAKAEAKAEKEAAEMAKAEAEAAAKREAEKASKPPEPPVMPQISEPTEPPANNAVKMLIAIIGGLFGLLIIASAMNTNNYYLKSADNTVEIWQGKFSPTGKELVMSVPNAIIDEPVKSVYAKKEAMVPAFDYYIGKAETLSEVKGLMDFETIKSNLYKAIKFAPTSAHKKKAKSRLNKIDFMFLVYKADVAAGKNTIEGYEAALRNLTKAASLGADKPQKELLNKKTIKINEALETIKEKIKANDAAAALEKEAEKEIIAPEKIIKKNTEPQAEKHQQH